MDGTVVKLKPSDVLHIPGLGFDGLVRYSPIAIAKNAIVMAIACEEYSAKFFANGATPGGILEHPEIFAAICTITIVFSDFATKVVSLSYIRFCCRTIIGTMDTSDSLFAVRSFSVVTSTPQGSWVLHSRFFIPSAVFAVDVSARLPVVPEGMSITVRQYSLYVTTRQFACLSL